ncbi:bifunctional 4-hydroxy-2-oxoglutarate aldolase/2-dehydro-3-deoxy-phosphogluconate aldolase [Propionibacteriaceae bacterium Y1685]
MTMINFGSVLAGRPVMAILRGLGVEASLHLTARAFDLGITAVELPVQTADDLDALTACVELGRARGYGVGAGTVLTTQGVADAAAAGAAFTVSPGLDADVARASLEAGLPHLPGVATASEITAALRLGLTWQKAFPASVLGRHWFTAMAGPFPQVDFVATGGMDAHNAADYLAAGARTVAVGSALADPAQLELLARLANGAGSDDDPTGAGK